MSRSNKGWNLSLANNEGPLPHNHLVYQQRSELLAYAMLHTAASVACPRHLSPSTLQRRLARKGIPYQSLKDELRRDAAITRLVNSNVPLTSLAAELGFADSAAFQRAFKGWTGSAPGAYRKEL